MFTGQLRASRRAGRRISNTNRARLAAAVIETLERRTLLSGVSFLPATEYGAGQQPGDVATGDLTGNGKTDLVVANTQSNTISVLMGNGDGTFQTQKTYSVGTYPDFVAIGDINGDGKQDLIVANGQSNTLSVLLGNGDGTFQAPMTIPVGCRPRSVAIADFNDDGKADLVVTNQTSGNVSVLLGNGNGTFQAPKTYTVGSGPIYCSVADLAGDGTLDLVVANSNSNNVSVLMGNGNGTFRAAKTYAVGSYPFRVDAADLGGDGTLDLVATNTLSNSVSVLMGSGNGTFQAQKTYAVGQQVDGLVIADLTGDGKLDLAVANGGTNTIGVLMGNGNGTFQAQQTFAEVSGPISLAVGDFNRDGKPDLVTANEGTDDVGVLLNSSADSGGGTFVAQAPISAGTASLSLAVGDFNGDGIPDIAVANAGSGTVSILLGNANGTFATGATLPVDGFPDAIAVGDFNGDGKLDLAVTNDASGTVSILMGNGNGTFAPQTTVAAGSNPDSIAVGDFSGNGKLDLAVVNYGSNTVSILMGNGDGTFALTSTVPVGSGLGNDPDRITVGDFNHDGKLDLAVANPGSNTVSILLGNGDGTFAAQPPVAVGNSPSSVTMGDFNDDGKLDLAVTDEADNTVTILLGNGDGTFTTQTILTGENNPFAIAAGDFNGDGKLDLALAYRNDTVGLLLGNGDGTFAPQPPVTAGNVTYSIAAGDFNGDGKLDLALANEGDGNGSVTVLLNTAVPMAPSITSSGSATFTTGTDGDFSIITSGSPTPAISETGNLPNGVTFFDNGNGTATLTGTPLAGTDGIYDITITAANGVSPNAVQMFTLDIQSPTIYVDADTPAAPNAQDGTSWATAFASLQTALGMAVAGDTILVAQGTYLPSITDDQSASFQLVSDVTMEGGFGGNLFASMGGDPNARNVSLYPTILSGNIGTPAAPLNSSVVVQSIDTGSSTLLDGFTITGGVGGTGSNGGGLNMSSSVMTINDCIFIDNSANLGGAIYATNSSPTITNCIFTGDTASRGGSVYDYDSSPELLNCLLSGDSASGLGGAIFNEGYNGQSKVVIINCTIAGDSASSYGAIANSVYFGSAIAIISNSIIYGDGPNELASGSMPNYSDVQGGFAGDGNINADPLFVRNPNATVQDPGDLVLQAASPAIDAGDNQDVPDSVMTDLFGNPRIFNGRVDMGAYEFVGGQAPTFNNLNSVNFAAGSSSSFTISTTGSPLASFTETGALPSGITFTDNGNGTATLSGSSIVTTTTTYDLTLTAANGNSPGATQVFALTMAAIPPTITSDGETTFTTGTAETFTITTTGAPNAALTETGTLPAGVTFTDNGNGTATLSGTPTTIVGTYTLTLTADNGVSPDAVQIFTLSVEPQTFFVDADTPAASSAQNGASWATAFANLQSALELAVPGDVIEVAQGTYLPTSNGNPEVSFQLVEGVAVKGGYGGNQLAATGGDPNSRDASIYKTILSGDIGGMSDTSLHSYSVVTAEDVDSTTILNGITVTGGDNTSSQRSAPQAAREQAAPNNQSDGGGMYIFSASPTINNCVFTDNLATNGGAIYDGDSSAPDITNCTFAHNSANYGAAILDDESSPLIENCTFTGNVASEYGGAVLDDESISTISNCTFNGNSAFQGGAIDVEDSSSTILDCIITNNTAGKGGGIYDYESTPEVINCLISGDSATGGGGGAIYNYSRYGENAADVINCTLTGDTAPSGGGAIYNYYRYSGDFDAKVTNSIIFGDGPNELGRGCAVTYSDVQYGSYGVGNINADPLFIRTPNTSIGDSGDLALQPGSPAIDAGNNNAVPNNITTDLAGNSRIFNGTVDMGAYEFVGDQAPAFTSNTSVSFATGTFDSFTITTTGLPDAALTEMGALPNGVVFADNGNGTATLFGMPNTGTGGLYYLTLTASNGDSPDGVEIFTLRVTPQTLYVDADTPAPQGNQDGNSWATAYASLQSALAVAVPGDTIRVAQGTYLPTVTDNPNISFQLVEGVILEGGFGGNESAATGGDPNTRNIAVYSTVLSGEIAGDGGYSNYSYHVVTSHDVTASTVIDGFTIAHGAAYGSSYSTSYGGGMYNSYSSPLVENCTFTHDSAEGGGAISDYDSSPELVNCLISGDSASRSGGAIYNYGRYGTSSPTIINCTIVGDSARNYGAIYNRYYSGDSSNPSNSDSSSSPDNSNQGSYASATITNCIIYGDGPNELSDGCSVNYSDVQYGNSGGGDISSDPMFVNPDGGNYQLQPGSPAIDAGSNEAVPSGITTDLAGNPRIIDGRVDMGAYEFVEAPSFTSDDQTTFTPGSGSLFTITTTSFPTDAITEMGNLPSGVTFTENGDNTATLSGTPAPGSAQTYTLTLTADNGVSVNATQVFTLTVDAAPAITSANSVTFTTGTAGSLTVTTTAFPTAALTESGNLPSGVTFIDNGDGTATLAGTPAAGSGATYTLTLTAANGVLPNATQVFTLTVDQAPAITSAGSATFTIGTAGSFNITTTGFPTPMLKESGSLPSGVTFTDNGNDTAMLAGTPTSGGTFTLTLTAVNGAAPSAMQVFTLTVDQAPAITSAGNATFTTGTLGGFIVTTVGFPLPALTETGDLPGGVTFTDNGNGSAILSGTPSAAAGGVFDLTLTAANGVMPNATQSFTLTVDQAPAITSAAGTMFIENNTAAMFTISTTGFPTAALTEMGALPAGLTFLNNGNGTASISGVATVAGTFNLTLTAGNSTTPNATQAFTLTVVPPPTIMMANSGLVVIGGTTTNDVANATVSNGMVVITIDNQSQSFPINSVTGLQLNLLGPGNDNVVISNGVPATKIKGGSGKDMITVMNTGDTVHGGQGSDTIASNSGGNSLRGGAGDDLFLGYDSSSGDTIRGGNGLSFAQNTPLDVMTGIYEVFDPTPPPPSATPSAAPAEASPVAPQTAEPVTEQLDGTILAITGRGPGDSISVTSDGTDINVVADGSDLAPEALAGLTGIYIKDQGSEDTVNVGSSVLLPATIHGNGGHDSLTGGGGDNVLTGGGGDDTLGGGGGMNLLVPGQRVVFSPSAGGDSLLGGSGYNIADFSRRTDGLYLSNDGVAHDGNTIATNVQAIWGGTGPDTIIGTIGGEFLSGGSGQDSIHGGGVNDLLVGGKGRDTVVVAAEPVSLFLRNNKVDDYSGVNDPAEDILQLDSKDVNIGIDPAVGDLLK